LATVRWCTTLQPEGNILYAGLVVFGSAPQDLNVKVLSGHQEPLKYYEVGCIKSRS